MKNFNLKKFLVENKLTTNSKMLKEEDESNTGKTISVTRASDGYGKGGRIDIANISPSLLEDMVLVVGMLRELAENDPELLSDEELSNVIRISNQIQKITY